MAENQRIIEQDVAHYHHQAVDGEGTGLRDSHIECTEKCIDKGKGQTADTPLQIAVGGLEDLVRTDDAFSQSGGETTGHGKQKKGK